MVKRGVWIVACIIGTVVCGGVAVLMGYAMFTAVQSGGSISLRGAAWPIGLLLFAGACAAGIFMTPREFEVATKPDEDEPPAQWIQDMRNQDDASNQPPR